MDVRELIDGHALLAIERQLVLADLLGDGRYAVDLDTATATLAGGLELRVGLLGTAAPGPGTWLWGWANPGGYREEVLATAERVRAFGEEHAVAELVQAEVVLDERWDATRAGIASVAATGIPAWFPVEAAGGTQVLLGVESELPPAPPTVEPTRLPQVLGQAIPLGIVSDWERALAAYGAHRGAGVRREGSAVVLEPAGGDHGATLELDELGRVTSLSMTRSAAPHDPQAPASAAPPAPEPEPRRRGLFRRRG